MDQGTLQIYVGLALSFIFSLFFVGLLFRFARNPVAGVNVPSLVALGLIACVTFVGNAPYVSLIQSVVISLGCLSALCYHLTKAQPPNARIVGLLIVCMVVCLLINQASRSFDIGLLRWFNVSVKEQQNTLGDVTSKVDALRSKVNTLEDADKAFQATIQDQVREHASSQQTVVADAVKAKMDEYRIGISQKLTEITHDTADLRSKLEEYRRGNSPNVDAIAAGSSIPATAAPPTPSASVSQPTQTGFTLFEVPLGKRVSFLREDQEILYSWSRGLIGGGSGHLMVSDVHTAASLLKDEYATTDQGTHITVRAKDPRGIQHTYLIDVLEADEKHLQARLYISSDPAERK